MACILAVGSLSLAGCPAHRRAGAAGLGGESGRSADGGAAEGDEPWAEGDEGDLPEPFDPAADDQEFVLDSAQRPDWIGLPSGITNYRGVPALVGLGMARAEGEASLAHLVARRKARAQAYSGANALARLLARKVKIRDDELLLLETQLQGFVDVLLPDHRRFVPVWQDPSSDAVHAAVMIPLERFLGAVRDSWDVPDAVRTYLTANFERALHDAAALR